MSEHVYTIKDVAKLANAGIATVSRYINSNGYVSKANQERIEKAIQELNYQPNAIARAIKLNKTNTIALIIPTISNPFFTELAEHVEINLLQNGYKVVLCNTFLDEDRVKTYIEMAVQNKFDGIISATGSQDAYALLKKHNMPVVWVDRIDVLAEKELLSVKSDYFQGTVLALQYLIKTGAKKIGHLLPTGDASLILNLHSEAITHGKGQVDYEPISYQEFDHELFESIIKKKFDALLVWNDILAIDVINFCHHHGIKVPQDMQIVGYDDISFASKIYPGLTTVKQPIDQIALKATTLLLENLKNPAIIQESVTLKNSLVIRESTQN